MRFFLVLTSYLFLLTWLASEGNCAPIPQETPLLSQESSPPSGSATVEPNQAVLRSSPVGPFHVFPFPLIFEDRLGNPLMIIRIGSFQELEKELFREERKNSYPPYSLQKIEAVGQVEGQIAQIRFDLTLSTSNDPLVSVPIGLREGVLQPASSAGSELDYVGEGSCALTVDPQNGDYLLLVQNPQQMNSNNEVIFSRLHQVAFTLSFPVENIGPEEQRMKISAPQAVSSRLILSVPISDAVATDTQGITPLRSTKTLPDGGTQFEIRGFPKLLDLSWYRQVQSTPPEKQVAIQVENAQILVHMKRHETEFDATLPIRAIGGPLQRFRVRLPPLTRYRAEPTETSEYQIHEITLPESPDSPILEIEVTGSSKQETPPPVRIRAVRSFSTEEQEKQSTWCELGGFEVLGTERQYGHVEINVMNDLKLDLRNQHGIRLDESDDSIPLLDTSIRLETQVRFVYYTQPFSLEARVTSPPTRISVKPEYLVLLEKGQMTLKGQIQTVVSGSKTKQLQWNFHDWQLEDVSPSTLVDLYDGVPEKGNNGMTTIPLRFFMDGPIELTFTARRSMPLPGINNQATVGFSFPAPIADRIEPAMIAIVPADNLELLNNTNQEVTGMSRWNRSASPKIPLPPRQQLPLIFRSDGDLSKPTMSFRSDAIFHKQEVQAHSRAIVQILEPKDQIKQTIRYNVKFEPLDQVTLLIPRPIHDSDSLKISFGDKSISESGSFSFPDVVAGTNLVRRRIMLPTPLIGSETLLLQYSMPHTEIPPEMTTRMTVPQILPADVEIVEQSVVASAPSGVNISLADGNVSSRLGKSIPSNLSLDSDAISPKESKEQDSPWRKLENNGDGPGLQETVFSTTSWEPSLSLSVRLDHKDILGTTVVERAWIQTWFIDQIRVDQASFRIQSDREKIALYLPVGFDRTHVHLTWDDTPIPLQYEEGALVITQPKEQRSQSHLLVVKYRMPNKPFSSAARSKIDLPYFESDVWVRRTYWQVVLPQNQHLFGDLSGWTPEFHWNWTGLYWKRDSSLSQGELELWIGSPEKQDLNNSPEITCYLFSSFNPQRQSELFIINRERLVLFSSGIILLIGFALIYFPRLRHSSVVFTMAVLLISIFLYKPTPALLVFQASILGVAVSLVSAILARIFYRESDWNYIHPYVSPNIPTPIKGTTLSSAASVPQEVLVENTQHTSSILDGEADT